MVAESRVRSDRAAGTPSRPTVRLRRIVGAISLPIAFLCQLLCNSTYAWVSTDSGLTDTGVRSEALAMYGRYPAAFLLMTVFAMVGVLVMIPGLLAALRVLRPHKPRLALTAVTVMIAGYICYFGIVMTNFETVALAEYSAAHPGAELGEIFDASPVYAAQVPFFLLFVVGNLLGTVLLGLAVILSRALPWYAGALIMGWTVGHLLNLFGGGEWFAVAGGALEITGLAIVAAAALRTSDAEWAARG